MVGDGVDHCGALGELTDKKGGLDSRVRGVDKRSIRVAHGLATREAVG